MGYPVSQRWDLVTATPSGIVKYIDHKSTAWDFGPKIIRREILDVQFLVAEAFGRAFFGNRWGGVELNLVRWSAGSAKNRSPELFQRVPLPGAPWAVLRMPAIVAGIVRRRNIARTLPPEAWEPRWNRSICEDAFGICPAFEFCRHGPGALGEEGRARVLALMDARERLGEDSE